MFAAVVRTEGRVFTAVHDEGGAVDLLLDVAQERRPRGGLHEQLGALGVVGTVMGCGHTLADPSLVERVSPPQSHLHMSTVKSIAWSRVPAFPHLREHLAGLRGDLRC